MKIAIIGAGIAGLTAAQGLRSLGCDVHVFEKSRGVGGRVSTKRLEWAHIDMGAQYFTARDPRFKKKVADWIKKGIVAPWAFTPYCVNKTALIAKPDEAQRFVGVPSMNALCKHLALDIDVTFNAQVESVCQIEQGWRLNFATDALNTVDRRDETWDWVVCTAPGEQSKNILREQSIAERIPLQVHEPCWAVALATKGEVMPEVQGIFGDADVSWVSRLSCKPQHKKIASYDDLWLVHFSPAWSASWVETKGRSANKELADEALRWLNQHLFAYAKTSLSYSHHIEHFWRFARVTEGAEVKSSLVDADAKLAAIGDWTVGGRVEGAFVSAMAFVEEFKKYEHVDSVV